MTTICKGEIIVHLNVSLALTIIAAAHICSAVAGPLPKRTVDAGCEQSRSHSGEYPRDNLRSGLGPILVRPPASYTNTLKRKQIDQYHYKDKKLSSYEEDHFIPLELGGHPRDPRNLWPQQYHIACGARIKDVIESKLKYMVCHDEMTLADARGAIATDWVAAYKEHIHPEGCPALEPDQ
jgi:hypothetical protein